MPVMKMLHNEPTCTTGSGKLSPIDGRRETGDGYAAIRPPSFVVRRSSREGTTVTNAGQSPSRQEKSLLHDDWWICVLRPNSVSTGRTLRQFDLTPQSPQPSQTAWLMNTRVGGSVALPRLRRRRSSAAHT